MKKEQKPEVDMAEMAEMAHRAFEKAATTPGHWYYKKLEKVSEIVSRLDPADLQDLLDGKAAKFTGEKDKALKNNKLSREKTNGAVKVPSHH